MPGARPTGSTMGVPTTLLGEKLASRDIDVARTEAGARRRRTYHARSDERAGA